MLPTQLFIAAAFAAGILFGLGILFVGRPCLLRLRSRKTAQVLDRTAGDSQKGYYS
jgi:hypothetical protein